MDVWSLGNHGPHSLKLDYGDFISTFPWDVYGTITFRQKRVDSIYWAGRIWQALSRFGASRAVIAVEPHTYEGIHLHTLSRHSDGPVMLSRLWAYSFKSFGRSSFEAVDSVLSVSRYCAKYVVKGNVVEFEGRPEAWTYDSLEDSSYIQRA